MRKQAALALLLLLAAAIAFGQTAILTEPKAGGSLAIGTTAQITWNSSGATWIKLVLIRNLGPDGKVGIIKSNLALKAGSYSWKAGLLENGKVVPPGDNYAIRIVNMADNRSITFGPSFALYDPANPPTAEPTIAHPVKDMARYIIASLPPPAGTTFAIKKINYRFESEGKLDYIEVIVSVNSPREFAISPSYGNPQYGGQWIKYTIDNPEYTSVNGIRRVECCQINTVSVKGGGDSQPLSQYPTAILPAGASEYALSFKSACAGLAKGIGVFQKMPGGFFQPGKLCKREYYPKLKLQLTAFTALGEINIRTEIYLVYDTNRWPLKWFSQPGETNVCVGGMQNW